MTNDRKIKAVIICDDTLRAVGLQYILADIYDIEAGIVHGNEGEVETDADIYFITPDALVKRHRFFMPRMERTVVLTHEGVNSPVLTLDTSRQIDDIIEHLDPIVNSLPKHRHSLESLSEREAEVLKLVAQGLINKEIASQLNISFNTVLSHRKNIMAKLGIKTTSGLVVYAVMNGLIAPPRHRH